jgi:hypothetical protein
MDGAGRGLNLVADAGFSGGMIGDGDQHMRFFTIGVDAAGAMDRLDQGVVAEAAAAD